jgi:hypothetical protein
MNVMAELGWDFSKQEEIRHKVRNTRESVRHTVASMVYHTFLDEYYIRITDRVDFTPYVVAKSRPIETREEQIALYDRLISALGLPWCCKVHKEEIEDEVEAQDDDFEFMPEEEEFEFDLGEDEEDLLEFDLGTEEIDFDFEPDDEEEIMFDLD